MTLGRLSSAAIEYAHQQGIITIDGDQLVTSREGIRSRQLGNGISKGRVSRSPRIITAGEVGVDGTQADEAAVHGHRSGDPPVSEVEDSRSCAHRVSRVAGLGKLVP